MSFLCLKNGATIAMTKTSAQLKSLNFSISKSLKSELNFYETSASLKVSTNVSTSTKLQHLKVSASVSQKSQLQYLSLYLTVISIYHTVIYLYLYLNLNLNLTSISQCFNISSSNLYTLCTSYVIIDLSNK